MRTLKKALSLVLVLAMVFTLAVPALAVDKASEFKDYDKVENKEAVDVLTAIGVLNGNPDGTFGAEGTFTRAQAATMITYLTLGKTVADALPATGTQFSDVPASFWGAKYIAYCAQEGIISGMGDGKFAPDAKLTAAQWALMLLKAVDAKGADEISGNGYELATTKLAINTKLAEADDMVGEFTRDTAAKLAFNALFYTEKGTTSSYVVKNNKGIVLYEGNDAVVALLMKQENATNTLEVKEVNDGSLADEVFKLIRKTSSEGEEVFGRPATTYTQEGAKKNPIAICAKEPVATYTTKVEGKTIYKDLGLTAAASVSSHLVDGESKVVSSVNLTADAKWTVGGNGTLTEVYKVSDNAYSIVEVQTHFTTVKSVKTTTDKTTGVATTTTTLKNNLTSTEFTSFSKNDPVLYTAAVGKTTVASLQNAKMITGVLTKATTVNGVPTFTIDGDEYQISAASALTADAIIGANNTNMGKTVSYYVDNYGYLIAAVDPATQAVGSYIQVLAADKSTTGADYMNTSGKVTGKVYGVLSNGTYGEYTVNYTDSDAFSNAEAGKTQAAKTIYKYTTNSSGELLLETVTNNIQNGFAKTTAAIANGATSATTENGTVVLNSATNYMFYEVTSDTNAAVKNFSTKTGTANSGNIPAGAIVVTENYITVAVFVGGQYIDPSVTADIVYVDADTKTTSTEVIVDENGKTTTATVYSYKAHTADGEVIDVTSKDVNIDVDALYYYNTDKTLGNVVAAANVLNGTLKVYGSTVKVEVNGDESSKSTFYGYNADMVNFMEGTTDATLTSGQKVVAVKASTGNVLTHIWVLVDAPEA